VHQGDRRALFIDEAYGLADDQFGDEAIETLVKQWRITATRLVVIVAGYPGPMEGFIDATRAWPPGSG